MAGPTILGAIQIVMSNKFCLHHANNKQTKQKDPGEAAGDAVAGNGDNDGMS
jgi:hypothetical protein